MRIYIKADKAKSVAYLYPPRYKIKLKREKKNQTSIYWRKVVKIISVTEKERYVKFSHKRGDSHCIVRVSHSFYLSHFLYTAFYLHVSYLFMH